MNATTKMVNILKEEDQDFEWYPTTNEMLEAIKKDLEEEVGDSTSILDCGAGDGRALNYLTEGEKYAIEKAEPLLHSMNKDIFIVGTDFDQQTLIDKNVDIVFSNPPYSAYEEWTIKIIKEANAATVYLIIPERWEKNIKIQDVIQSREAKTKIIGRFDFLQGDRAARAKVHVLRITLAYKGGWNTSHLKTDPFEIWFDEHFKLNINEKETEDYEEKKAGKETLKDEINNELTKGNDLVKTLYEFYQRDMEKLITTYKSLNLVDANILIELDVNIEGLRKALEMKIKGLKDRYWNELFNNFHKVTDRLTKSSREKLLGTLTSNTHVDFTIDNAYAVIIWVIKNSNKYFESQLITAVEFLVDKSSIQLYKSNKKTFGEEQWRYCRKPEDLDKYSLDYRIVTTRTGGLNTSGYSYNAINGLSNTAADYLNDLCAIATNIGFDTTNTQRAHNFEWDVHVKNVFQYKDIHTGIRHDLFEAKAYKNGNLHLKFNQAFMCRLNVEFGRLKGWIKSPKQAAEDLDITIQEASESFNKNLKLEVNCNLMLEHKGE